VATIRQALEKDIPRILELYQQLTLPPATPENKEPFKAPPPYKAPSLHDCSKVFKKMSEYPNYHLLVAEDGGLVVGTLIMAILPGFAHGVSPFTVVEYVVVDEKCRSKGIGKKMMEAVKSYAKTAGCYKIILTSDKRRERAHKFYKSIGFEPSAEGFRFYF
jgi:ribosomal protein S18 acetylase RimI-like enzyme